MKHSHIGVLAVAVAFWVGACGVSRDANISTEVPTSPPPTSTTSSPVIGELITFDAERTSPSVSDRDLASVTSGDANLGLDLLAALASDENTMISPYSVATALSMLYPGARGETARQIADAMYLEVDDTTLHEVRNYIEASLSANPAPRSDSDTREPFSVRGASSAWGQIGFEFEDDFLKVLALHYGAGLRVLDYVADPAGSAKAINDWIEEATEDRIANLIPPSAISGDTRLILANALWFKASWAEQFDQEDTDSGEFTLLDGSAVSTDLMHANLTGSYADSTLFTAVRLPYAGEAAMVVALPKLGTPAELAALLRADDLRPEWTEHEISLTLPRFEFDSTVPLADTLKQIGVADAFDEQAADLSGISQSERLALSDAFQKTFIAVDEEGTEASAATALSMGLTSISPPADFTADRPFLFWIEHTTTNQILFLGQVTDPAAR